MDILLVKRQQIIGVLPAPPGITPNFEHPTSHGHVLAVASVACVVIAALFVGARLFTKVVVSRSPGWDDVTAVIALALSAALSGACLVCVDHYGLGHHLYEVPVALFEPFLKYSIAQAVLYGTGIYFAKITIFILLLRIFGVDQRFRAASWFVIIIWTSWITVHFSLCLFGCNPIKKAWKPMIPGKCIDIIQVGIASGYVNIVTDIIILVLPMPMVWQLHLRTKLKVAVSAVFLTGTFGCIASIIRQVEVVKTLGDPDATWHNSNSLLWLVIELNVCIICGCMPVMRPLFSHLVGGEPYADSTPKRTPRSVEYQKHISSPSTGAPGKPMNSGLMDASYIELGPTRNNQVNVSAKDSKAWHATNGGIMTTHTFGTNITYQERGMASTP